MKSMKELFEKVRDLGAITRDLQIGKSKFKIQLPDSEAERKITVYQGALEVAKTQEEEEHAYDTLRRYTIGYFLVEMEGTPIPEILQGESGEEIERAEFIAENALKWPPVISDIIYSACQDLRKEARKDLYGSVKCKWFDTPLYERAEKDAELAEQIQATALQQALKRGGVEPGRAAVDAAQQQVEDENPSN